MLRRERGFGLLSPKAQISLSLCCHPNWLKDPWHGSDELIYCRQLVFVNACFATRIRVLSRHHAGHTVDFNGPCSFKPYHCNGQHFQLPFKEWSHPLDYVHDNKFWPSVRRVDDAYGDRNLICTCAPIEAFMEA